MQTEEFSVDRSATPWSTIVPRVYSPYSSSDCMRILSGLQMSLTLSGSDPMLLVPLLLSPSIPSGSMTYVAIFRGVRVITMLQFEVGLTATSMYHITRPVSVSDGVKAAYPNTEFVTANGIITVRDEMFWGVLRSLWVDVFNDISLPYELSSTCFDFACDNRPGLWTNHPPATDRLICVYGLVVCKQIELCILELCKVTPPPSATSSALVVYIGYMQQHFVALTRSGTTINVVDVKISLFPACVFTEHRFLFPSNMHFQGFEFTSVRLNDSDKIKLFQEPVSRHYHAIVDGYFITHFHIPILTAFAMGLHSRLGADSVLRCIDGGLAAIIADMAY